MSDIHKYLKASFDDEHQLMDAIKELRNQNVRIRDVFTPFPVHGLDHLLGYRRSNIPKVGFWGGFIGAAAGLGFQAWVFTKAYPINFGGKPFFSLPSFIPVTFECTILFAAFAMVFAFLIRSKLGLGAKNKIYDERSTNDKFVLILESAGDNESSDFSVQQQILENFGASITVKP